MKVTPLVKNIIFKEYKSLHDFESMDSKAYSQIKNALEPIKNYASEKGKFVDFYDFNSSIHDKKMEKYADSKNILVVITDIMTGNANTKKVIFDEKSNVPFLRQIFQAVSELSTGKKTKPIDDFISK